MPITSVPQGLWLPPRVATLFVAASDALDRSRAQADYLCGGVVDDVQINQALNALPAGIQGRVILSEGTFNIVNPITIPANNITLRGQGRSTFINGNGLATNEHGIVISGVINCTIKKLSIQTQAGGGKTCHCIFIEDGANSFEIEYVTIVNSDSDGIAIEGTNILDGSIHNCHINAVDGYGIMVAMDNGQSMLRLNIFDNFITGAGNAGIALWNGAGVGNATYCNISQNVIYTNGNEGIIAWDSDYTVITGNVVVGNTQWGIRLRGSEHANLSNNVCYLNGSDNILLEGSIECVVEGNVCVGSVAANSDGIQVGGINNDIVGNHCCENGRHGINIIAGGSQCSVIGNFCHENNQHGISVADVEVKVSGNYCYDNSQGGAGTYHGINLAAGADRCQINDNLITDPGDSTEDGIYLASGAVNCHIMGNYIYNLMGDGIKLIGSNTSTVIEGNYCFTLDENGIVITDSTDCVINGNHCENNTHFGIYLDNADRASMVGNTCIGNDRLNSGNYDGIYVDSDCIECLVSDNYCYTNHRYGISVFGGSLHSVTNNYVSNNDQHGISIAGAECSISGNHIYHNGIDAADTYHGIYLLAGADRCAVNNNYIADDGSLTEDGICLADGAIDCQICDNYIYNLRGSGVMLTANNLDCLIKGNYIEICDSYGIEIAAVTCSKNVVEGNKLKGNVTGNLLDSGVLTTVEESNKEITPPEIKRYVYMKNTYAAPLAAGDVVVFKAGVAAGDEFTTTTTLGDDHVLGMVAEAIAVDAYGYVQVAGKTTALQGSNDNGNIVIGDFLCTSDTPVEAVKAGALDTAFAIALADLAGAGPTAIAALLINPMTF